MEKKIAIVGAGLSGSLLAIILAKKGYDVEVYERRPDMRKVEISAGRSINLALSDRGIKALKLADLDTDILKEAVPMFGRQIHLLGGSENFQSYSGREGEHINSVSRGGLNCQLMDKVEGLGIPIYFNQKCLGMDYKSSTLSFLNEETKEEYLIEVETAIATDGAGSAIRNDMQKKSASLRFSFSKAYLDHGYKELCIPPTEDGDFRMEKNALHIWPRGGYMLIALPNKDGSFTVTLFHPYDGENGLDALNTSSKARVFFEKQFPDALALMPSFDADWENNPTSSLATVKCYPWQVEGKSLLLGDSAHAIVPFYGQGMNCSFEDCVVFAEYLEKYKGDWEKIFSEYQKSRKKDTDAIATLAEDNFYEMRDHVSDENFMKKRKLETKMEQQFPEYYSKYSLVTFNADIPYSEAMRKGRAQDQLLLEICRETDDLDSLDLEKILQQIKSL
ncbi:FAD-dependent oxidoreductase [Sediminitomix flava]|uniref:Kynurenine 3-monooxygenase n=1 Tax=Sediminitomix flava TaxID=379075 RepID=A0A315Z966_SEDFL|nr:NAD(P)/FAD-dependent oxidoreductase [Sediminitomix flava]PWJ42116.1 kynurenine 3-monooxygenase [Sediminitomix flava]